MKTISNASFEGERPLFNSKDLHLEKVVIHPGESALKECKNIIASNCYFEGKYPFWHNENTLIDKCTFTDGARAAIWYCKSIHMKDSKVDAPKMFREIDGLTVENTNFPNALETFWYCRNLNLSNVQVFKADYVFTNNKNIKMINFELNGNYSFQYCKDVEIRNSVINSKDAFWNSENVTIYDSKVNGEYLGWHSKNLRLVNCKISGTQPFCYCTNLVLENCTMDQSCDLCFEYSTVNAEVHSVLRSVKNPTSGKIIANGFEEIIIDENVKEPNNCQLIKWNNESSEKNDIKINYNYILVSE